MSDVITIYPGPGRLADISGAGDGWRWEDLQREFAPIIAGLQPTEIVSLRITIGAGVFWSVNRALGAAEFAQRVRARLGGLGPLASLRPDQAADILAYASDPTAMSERVERDVSPGMMTWPALVEMATSAIRSVGLGVYEHSLTLSPARAITIAYQRAPMTDAEADEWLAQTRAALQAVIGPTPAAAVAPPMADGQPAGPVIPPPGRRGPGFDSRGAVMDQAQTEAAIAAHCTTPAYEGAQPIGMDHGTGEALYAPPIT